MVTYDSNDKGDPITIVDGTYFGLNGWLWLGKKNTVKQVHVIVETQDGKEKGLRVKRVHVEPRHGPPTSYVEAALQQHPEIARDLNQLCKKLAKCKIKGSEEQLHNKIRFSVAAAYEQQLAEGTKAAWYTVDYESADSM